jgi:amino acid transporter
MTNQENGKALDRYLSPTDVWALAFGCMVGWGVFAMPGTTFLPIAGPAGTVLSLLIGMAVMLMIAGNFSYLMGRSSMTGGLYSYTKEAFGRDHAFLSCWFLCLSYLTIVFLNGTALFLIVRTLFSDASQTGLHYTVAGNTIYLGETVVSVLALAVVGVLFILAKPLLQRTQTVLALVLLAGIIITAAFCLPSVLRSGVLRDFGIRGLNRSTPCSAWSSWRPGRLWALRSRPSTPPTSSSPWAEAGTSPLFPSSLRLSRISLWRWSALPRCRTAFPPGRNISPLWTV